METTNFKVPLKDLVLPKEWNRDSAEGIEKLALSLKTVGQLVPLIVTPIKGKKGKYDLKDGMRRVMAMKSLSWKEAFVSFSEGTGTTAKLQGIVANLSREGHSSPEIANVFSALVKEGMKHQDIAKACCKTGGFVSQHLDLLKLPEEHLSAISKGTLLFSQARELVKLLKTNKPSHQKKFDALVQRALNGLPAAEISQTIVAFLAKEDAKAKEALKKNPKATDPKKGKKKKKDSPRGRPVKLKDYDKLRPKISPVNKTTLVTYLKNAEERRSKSTAKQNQVYLRGMRDGLELAAGLRE